LLRHCIQQDFRCQLHRQVISYFQIFYKWLKPEKQSPLSSTAVKTAWLPAGLHR
jgi:hypothetical protein